MSIVDYKADIDQLEGFRTTLTKENIRRAQLLAEATQQHQNATKLLEKTRSENATGVTQNHHIPRNGTK